ncbi:hypothetical protein [Virgibacillus sediminis]|uniref:Uncharacterized protein n=1 Tax=Virgibacillus sediminis TaxID=202260 RepID=A0ABV7A609_9BACI
MKEEYLIYAKTLHEIGDKIISITNHTANLNANLVYTKEQLLENKNNSEMALEEYNSLVRELVEWKFQIL